MACKDNGQCRNCSYKQYNKQYNSGRYFPSCPYMPLHMRHHHLLRKPWVALQSGQTGLRRMMKLFSELLFIHDRASFPA